MRLDFQNWASNLRKSQGFLGVCVSPINYNPVKETITLTGFSKQTIEEAKQELQKLLANISEHWGGKYLLTSHSDVQPESLGYQASAHNPSGAHGANNSAREKVFPVIPKEDRRLVELWFKHLLPRLPKILSPKLGGTYTASLVRRGADVTVAEPCIQIESPCIPKQKVQGIITDLLKEICDKSKFRMIKLRFSQGSIKKLTGGANETDEDVADGCSAHQQLKFSLFRPYSKPGMGASLGLLRSKKVVATLGGYVLVGGKKHMLTSEHFIERSLEQADIGGDDMDEEPLTSPSRHHLYWMENSLKQNMRDIESEIDRLTSSTFGDQDISSDDLGIQTIGEKMKERETFKTLLGQVNKPPAEYAIGSVFKRSTEPRISAIPKSIADISHLGNNQRFTAYHMDWALCRLNDEAAENRHKYRTSADAEADFYIEEKDHVNQPGDTCYQTCSAEAGSQVYYVGSGSMHREGIVNLPSLASRDSIETLDWAIRDPDDQQLTYEQVTGDSGAWVIRQHDNALMGQIHSHSGNQIFFTPIDIIFEDISKACKTEISLPPCPYDPGPIPMTTAPMPLCSAPSSPPLLPLQFLKRRPIPCNKTPKLSPLTTAPLETSMAHSSKMSASQSDTIRPSSQVLPDLICDSPSMSPPALTDSWQSPVSSLESLKSSQPFDHVGTPKRQGHIKQLPSKSWLEIADESTLFEVPYIPLGSQDEIQMVDSPPEKYQIKTRFNFDITLSAYAPTWPADRKTIVVKARLGTGLSRLSLSFRGHEMPFSSHSLFENPAQTGQRIGTCVLLPL